MKPFQTENGRECQRDLMRCAAVKDIDTLCPFDELPEPEQNWLLYGERPGAKGEELWENGEWYGVKGFFDWLETKSYKMHVRVLLSRYRNYTECPDCRGGRYQPATLNFRFGEKTLPDLMRMPVADLRETLNAQRPTLNAQRSARPAGGGAESLSVERSALSVERSPQNENEAAPHPRTDATTAMLRGEVCSRLGYLVEVGLGYLSLDRPTRTLSGGEVERVNLTTCLGASLVNTLFVLDEPSIGLHPRDTNRLIRVMQQLRDKGNTLLVVEHDEAVIRAADNLIELGPGRGEAGGHLVFNGPLAGLTWRRRLACKRAGGAPA